MMEALRKPLGYEPTYIFVSPFFGEHLIMDCDYWKFISIKGIKLIGLDR